MANSLLSPTIITREALRILHANLNFIGSINRQYDSQFANSGASPSGKIGPTLTIRKPNRFTVRTGAVIGVQDVVEDTTTLTVSTQKGVDFNFSSQDLTLTLDEFSKRYLAPAMARLASDVEADALSMLNDVYNAVDDSASAPTFLDVLNCSKMLDQMLAPDDGERVALLHLQHNVKLIDALKGLYNPQANLSGQYRKGMIAKDTGGFNTWYRNSLLTTHASGTAVTSTGYTINAAAATGSTITIAGGSTTFLIGDIVTLPGCDAVHPETKADLGFLQQFVVTSNSGASATSLSISPAIVTTGAKQNVTASPTNGGTILKVGGGASSAQYTSLFYHPDAFTFVSADLVDVSKFGAWGAREVQDGISMRIARQYDITNDKVPCRIDVLYGYKTIRPELAVRLIANS